jgi:beta-glucosidase
VQSKGVGTSLKHYAANSQETQRFSISAEIDERTLREIYLPAFEAAVKRAKPWTVMCAYNKLNGVFCSEHHELLIDILKNEWGFEGFVVSDWGAVHDRVKSLKGGLDLEMPGPHERSVKSVVQAVRSGECDISLLDDAVQRILKIVFKAQETAVDDSKFDEEAHHQLAQKIASEGIVLLKNNGILPLKGQEQIAVIGHSAKDAYFQGGGSSHVNPTRLDSPFTELHKRSGNAELVYVEGYSDKGVSSPALIDEAVKAAKSSDVTLLYISLPTTKESEGYDRKDIDFTEGQITLIKAVAKVQPNTVVILNNGSAVTMQDWIDDVAAVVEAWMMGQAGGGAVADVLYGNVNPSGKTAETFPLELKDTPAYLHWPGGAGEVRYGEGIYVGYRYYDARDMPVLFPFGYGLSYTTFSYSNPSIAESFMDINGLVVSVDVTNTGNVTGKEIVQVYVHDREAKIDRPPKELKGFAKVELEPGQTKTVTIPLDFRAFAFYHPAYHRWITEDGEFDILIGSSSADIRYSLTTSMKSTLKLPCLLNMESTIKDWLEDPRGAMVITPMIEEFKSRFIQMFEMEDDLGMEAPDMAFEMQLMSVLMFQQNALTMPPEDIIEGLLEQVHNMEL